MGVASTANRSFPASMSMMVSSQSKLNSSGSGWRLTQLNTPTVATFTLASFIRRMSSSHTSGDH